MPIRGALAGQRACRGAGSLVGPAVSLLLSAHGQAAWPFGPLVLVAPGPAAASTAVAAGGQPEAADVFLGSGRARPRHRGGNPGRQVRSARPAVRIPATGRDRRPRGPGWHRPAAGLRAAPGCRHGEGLPVLCLARRASRAGRSRATARLAAVRGPRAVRRRAGGPAHRAAGGREPSVARIIRVVAARRELAVGDLTGPSRRHTFAAARGLAMHLVRGMTSKSLAEIGAAFGGRDHTTVIHALKVFAERLLHDAGLAADVERCRARLAGPSGDERRGRRRPVDSPLPRRLRGA